MKTTPAVMLVLLVYSGAISAQSIPSWSVKAGYNQFRPQVRSGDITGVPGGKVDVSDGGEVFGSVTYALSEQVSTELAFGIPPKLDIIGQGSIGMAGKIANTKVWAPVLMLQYQLGNPDSTLRPYLGVGVTYTRYRQVTTTPVLSMLTNPGGHTSATIDNAWGAVAQAGITCPFHANWFLDAAVVPMRVKTTARLSTGQRVKVSVDPVLVNLAIGLRF